jgi:uncharacterized membrane protein
MATLSVRKFDDPAGAQRVMEVRQNLHGGQIITLEDATVVSCPQGNNEPLRPQQGVGKMELGAAFWAFLFWLIFVAPFLGATIGAGTAAALWTSRSSRPICPTRRKRSYARPSLNRLLSVKVKTPLLRVRVIGLC